MVCDRRGEAALEGLVAAPVFISPIYSKEGSDTRWLEGEYEKSGGIQWSKVALDYYRDDLDEEDKDDFLKVPLSDLDSFCSKREPSWLRNWLRDAVMFFKLHRKWEVHICQACDCPRWFSDGDALVRHLISEHCFPGPFRPLDMSEEHWWAEALDNTEWKPIDVTVAFNTLSTMSLELDDFHPASFKWPLSEDCGRMKLLEQLQTGFLALLNPREKDSSFILRSNGCFRALITVASDELLRRHDPMNVLPHPFRTLLYCSPLSFRFMEEEPLCAVLELVKAMCNLVKDQASRNTALQGSQDGGANLTQNEGLDDAVTLPAGCDYFVLDAAKLKSHGIDEHCMGSWLLRAPIFPKINKLAGKASEILQGVESKAVSFSKCLTTVCAQSNLRLSTLTSCLKMWSLGHWPRPLLDKLPPELVLNSDYSNTANVNSMPSPCYLVRNHAKRQTTEFDYQHYHQLIKLTCELQFLELQFRGLCAVDLRERILPLLRSYLRMKLYMFMRSGHGSVTGDEEEEETNEDCIIEGFREEHPEQHVDSKVNGEPAAADGGDVMTHDLSSPKGSEQLSKAPLELGSKGSSAIDLSIDISVHDCIIGSAGDTDRRASKFGSANAAPSSSRPGTAATMAEPEFKPEALPESDAEPELKDKPESQWSEHFRNPLWREFDMYSDSDLSDYEGESENGGHEMEKLSDSFWFMREKGAWETKDNGLFICFTINEIMKHCLESSNSDAALNIWGFKNDRTMKYWRCYDCGERFPDQKSHMLHMESVHYFRLSWKYPCWPVLYEFWQEGQSGVSEGVKERTCSLDDSITVDCAYRTFLVEMEKFGSSLQNEVKGEVSNLKSYEIDKLLWQMKELSVCLMYRLCRAFEIGIHDTEIVRNFVLLNECEQELSNLCVSDCKKEILHSVSSFLEKRNLMDSGLRSWSRWRLEDLLRSVRCSWHPDSFTMELTSPGKVIINIEEHNAGIDFTYIGICWKFSGDLSFKGSRDIKCTIMCSGASTAHCGIQFDWKVLLDEGTKMTERVYEFEAALEMDLTLDLMEKLNHFQAEFRWRLRV